MSAVKKLLFLLFGILYCAFITYGQRKELSHTQKDTLKSTDKIIVNTVIGNNNKIINGDQTIYNKTTVNKITNKYIDSSRHYHTVIDSFYLKELALWSTDYRPSISREIQDTLKKEFKELRNKYPGQPRPGFQVETGNNSRIEAILQLYNIFDQKDLPFYRPHVGRSGDLFMPSIGVVYDESVDTNYVNEYLRVLACYIPGIYFLKKVKSNPRIPFGNDPFVIYFNGEPFFNRNGTVMLK